MDPRLGTDPTDRRPEPGSTATHERAPVVPGERCHALGQRLQPTLPLFLSASQSLFRQKHHLSHRQRHRIPGQRVQALAPCQSPRLFLASLFPSWCCPEGNLLLLPGLGSDPAARPRVKARLGAVAAGGGDTHSFGLAGNSKPGANGDPGDFDTCQMPMIAVYHAPGGQSCLGSLLNHPGQI